MANSVTTQVLEDGHRNYVLKVVGILDTADVSATDLVDPAALNPVTVFGSTDPSKLMVKAVEFSVSDGLEVRLWWDATTDVPIAILHGQGKFCFDPPVRNNAGTGITQKIQYSTAGFSTADSFTFILHCIKVI